MQPFYYFELNVFIYIQIPVLFCYLALYLYFSKKDSGLLRGAFTLLGYSHVGCIAFMAGPESGIHFLMVGIAPFPALFFGTDKIRTLAIGPVLSLIWILLVELRGDLPAGMQPDISADAAALLRIFGMVNSLVMSFLFSIFFVFRIQKVEDERRNALLRATESERNRTRELAQSLQEKNTLLREIHHRIKNNLQLSVGIISHQIRNRKVAGGADIISGFQDRIRALARVHDHVYGQNESSRVNLKTYLEQTVRELRRSEMAQPGNLRLELDTDEADLSLEQAVPCGQLLNELITNSLKHAFTVNTDGLISVKVRISDDTIVSIDYLDNGCGLKAGSSTGTGTELISLLAAQLGLRPEVGPNRPSGVHYKFMPGDAPDSVTPDGRGQLLIVEDEILIARNLQANLKEQGFTVHDSILSEAAQVLDYLQTCPILPEVIVMDVKIKGETDGFTLAERIHRSYPQIMFLFSTGYERTDLNGKVPIRRGAYELLPKTMDMHDAVSAIRRLLDG